MVDVSAPDGLLTSLGPAELTAGLKTANLLPDEELSLLIRRSRAFSG